MKQEMERDKIIAEVVNKLKNYTYKHEIASYLKAEGIDESEFDGIMEKAESAIAAGRISYFKKRNRRFFYIWILSAFATLVLFLFVFPYKNVSEYGTILSVTGAVLFCLFSFLALAYNKSWETAAIEKNEKPVINFSFLVIFLMPAVIIYFIFSWRFSSAEDAMLKQTQEKATGTIVSGTSTQLKRLRGGAVDFSSVSVSFQTKEGVAVTATKDVTSYEFKNFYVGQKIQLIYSKDNPQNIDLLVNEANVREFMGSEERGITPQDLLNLMTVKKEALSDSLNKIKYGWEYNSGQSAWINEKINSALFINENEVQLIAAGTFVFTFPKELAKMGFIQISARKSTDVLTVGQQIFEKDAFIVTIRLTNNGGSSKSVITIHKKQQ